MSERLPELLIHLFTTEERFGRWLTDFGVAFAAEIPGGSLAARAHATVQELERRGRIDVALFVGLADLHPGRKVEIWAVAARYAIRQPPPPIVLDVEPDPEVPARRTSTTTPTPASNPSRRPPSPPAPAPASHPSRRSPPAERVVPASPFEPRGVPSLWAPVALCLLSAALSTLLFPLERLTEARTGSLSALGRSTITVGLLAPGPLFALAVALMLQACGLLRPRALVLLLLIPLWPVGAVLSIVPLIGSIPVALAVYGLAGAACGYWPRRRNIASLCGLAGVAALTMYALPNASNLAVFLILATWQLAVGLFLWRIFFVPASLRRA